MAKTKKTHGGRRPGAGRPRKFDEPTVSRSLQLPKAFWELLDVLEGSRSEAFVAALSDDKIVRRMRRALVGRAG